MQEHLIDLMATLTYKGEVYLAKILFRPVCSKCRRELHSVIDYQCVNFRGFNDWFVEPDRCPYCGVWFTSIEIPTRLPFDNISNPEKGK